MYNLRNIAIIAHVDHGKTTLVDEMIKYGQIRTSKNTPGELIMDSNDLERERGITILSKNVSLSHKDCKINVIDTPGHADFGGEVERVLNMADGVLLLVDAFEGPMPQTRFVLQKAIELGLKPIVVINKVDKANCKPEEAMESVFDLMFALGATEDQLDFPTLYGSAKQGWMSDDWNKPTDSIVPLLDAIVKYIPEPQVKKDEPLQMLITSLDYSPYLGRIAIGRVYSGSLVANQKIALVHRDDTIRKLSVKEAYIFTGLEKEKVSKVEAGEICALTGLEGFEIGDTISDIDKPRALHRINIDEPTMSMSFMINDSPFFGKEGKLVTSRHIRERLDKELEKNLALRLEETDSSDVFKVHGRGVLHLSILIETMRREGYELQIGQPQVLYREVNGKRCEPMEELNIDVPEEFSGKIVELVTLRKGDMVNMEPRGDRMFMMFNIPSRGLIGLRSQIIVSTMGEAIMTHRFTEYQPYKGDIAGRIKGSLVSMEAGRAIPYSLNNLQERGRFFVDVNEEIYEGQVIGEHTRPNDLTINVTKTKKLSNVRAAGSDDKVKLAPPVKFTLEEALEYIQSDELVEVTPKAIRLRKIHLKEIDRKRFTKRSI